MQESKSYSGVLEGSTFMQIMMCTTEIGKRIFSCFYSHMIHRLNSWHHGAGCHVTALNQLRCLWKKCCTCISRKIVPPLCCNRLTDMKPWIIPPHMKPWIIPCHMKTWIIPTHMTLHTIFKIFNVLLFLYIFCYYYCLLIMLLWLSLLLLLLLLFSDNYYYYYCNLLLLFLDYNCYHYSLTMCWFHSI